MVRPKTFVSFCLPIALFALATVLLAPSVALADEADQERARQAMLAGDVRPLSELLGRLETMYEGDVIEVELEDADFTGPNGDVIFLYEIKILTPQGNLVKLKFDAKNLELLTVDGHDSEKARKNDD